MPPGRHVAVRQPANPRPSTADTSSRVVRGGGETCRNVAGDRSKYSYGSPRHGDPCSRQRALTAASETVEPAPLGLFASRHHGARAGRIARGCARDSWYRSSVGTRRCASRHLERHLVVEKNASATYRVAREVVANTACEACSRPVTMTRALRDRCVLGSSSSRSAPPGRQAGAVVVLVGWALQRQPHRSSASRGVPY